MFKGLHTWRAAAPFTSRFTHVSNQAPLHSTRGSQAWRTSLCVPGQGRAGRGAPCTHAACFTHVSNQAPLHSTRGSAQGHGAAWGAGGEGTRACVHGRTLHHIPETLTTLLRTNEVVSKTKRKVKEERTGGTRKCWPADGTTPREWNSDSRELLTRTAFQ